MKICMFVNNPITNDGRVKREARCPPEATIDICSARQVSVTIGM
jgi:hypothetical protein